MPVPQGLVDFIGGRTLSPPPREILLPLTSAYLIALLVQWPARTRWARMGLWGVGVVSAVRNMFLLRGDPIICIRIQELFIIWGITASSRYAFTSTRPVPHPLPRQPFFARLRTSPFFQALDLLLNECRHVNLPPHPPLRRSPSPRGGYLPTLLHHIFQMQLNLFFLDLNSYPAYRLAPQSFGNHRALYPSSGLDGAKVGDFKAWVAELAQRWGVPREVVRLGLAVCWVGAARCGLKCTFHLLCVLYVGSGIWVGEECPPFWYQPWRSTSLNELWGKRYHQTLRDPYLTLATPFSHLPRPLHLLSVLLVSALFHILLYLPLHSQHLRPLLVPYLTFFLASGVGIILERAYYKRTGSRVRGWKGAAWTWTFMYLSSRHLVAFEFESGLAGFMRAILADEPRQSGVCWLVWLAGMGPDPRSINVKG